VDTLAPNRKKFTTLVVDEELLFEGFLRAFLEAEGHVALAASSVEEASSMIAQHQPDLILLNRALTGSADQLLIAEILLAHPGAAVILMAVKPSLADVVQAMHLGAVDYLELPLDFKQLKRAVDVQRALFDVL
jgi:DNA-binding NtrC family response regulator